MSTELYTRKLANTYEVLSWLNAQQLYAMLKEEVKACAEPNFYVMKLGENEHWEQVSGPVSLEEAKALAKQYPTSAIFRNVL